MKSNSTKRALLAGTFLVPQGQNKILFGAKMLSAQDRILSRGSCFLYGTYEQCYAFYDFGSRGLENFFWTWEVVLKGMSMRLLEFSVRSCGRDRILLLGGQCSFV